MAIDMITNNTSSLSTSPDEDCSYGSDSDFDFCISSSADVETSSADELFADGLIRPLQLQEKFVVSKSSSIPRPHSQPPPLPPLPPLTASESIKEEVPKEELVSPHPKSSSFWHFKRSWSLHSDSSHKKGSFWSLPLLARSNSTGSIKEGQKQSPNSKQPRKLMPLSSSSGSVASFYTYPLSQKPGLRKSYGGSHSNGVVINPVLNFPPPCNIRGAANLSVFGSLFSNGRDKNKDKK